MARSLGTLAVLGSVLLAAGCVPARKSSAGFHLPDGDAARGRAAFVELRCHACHEVVGAALPKPVADPAVPVALGGPTARIRTDGELVTSILDPSHRIAPGPQPLLVSGSRSRMGDFGEAMTGQQLVDLVAYLQSEYVFVQPGPHR
jgi:hypothetical protein